MKVTEVKITLLDDSLKSHSGLVWGGFFFLLKSNKIRRGVIYIALKVNTYMTAICNFIIAIHSSIINNKILFYGLNTISIVYSLVFSLSMLKPRKSKLIKKISKYSNILINKIADKILCFFSCLCSLVKNVKAKKTTKDKTKEIIEDKTREIFKFVFLLVIFCIYLFINTTYKKSIVFYIFIAALFCFVGYFAMREVNNSNGYMVNYLVATLVYIEVIAATSFAIQKFFMINFIIKKGKVNPKFLLYLSIVVMIAMITLWFIYFQLSKEMQERYNNIDLIDIAMLFLKSVLQSLTAFIAMYGLASSGLPSSYLVFALVIDAFAAFSYPILDINKYLREKEIEQNEIDKRYEPIKPNVKLEK